MTAKTTTFTNLSRTAAALDAYDRTLPEIDAAISGAQTDAEVSAALEREERLAEAVGVAFGQDTKAFNNPEDCRRLVRPGRPGVRPGERDESFVRVQVRRWRQQTGR